MLETGAATAVPDKATLIRGNDMTRKLALLALTGILLGASAAQAQGQPAPQQSTPAQQPAPPSGGAATPVQGAPLSQLGLSDDQKKQIHDIREQTQQQVASVKNDSSFSPQQKQQKIHQLRRTASQNVDGVLTPDQRQKYNAWRKTHRPHHKHHPKPQAPQP
jgi:Spy/CpxP family protein refolding chaperone